MLDKRYGYGKQSLKRGGMWYTPISGIWQAVWLESVPKSYFKSLKIIPTLDSVEIYIDGGLKEKTLSIDGKSISFSGNSITLDIEDPICWTPENPHLYYFSLEDGQDKIESYFALRTVSVERVGDTSYICLNGSHISSTDFLIKDISATESILPQPRGIYFRYTRNEKSGL